MRVLVTGADGFVGKHLCRHLREQGDEVVEVGGTRIDIADGPAVARVVAEGQPDAAIHLAGFSSVAQSHADPARAFVVNALGTVNLLEGLRRFAPKARMVLVSSGEVYGNLPGGEPAKETSPLSPSSPYAASKLAAEVAGLQFFRSYGLEVICARPFNHVGAGQAPHFVVPSIARQLLAIRRAEDTRHASESPRFEVGNLEPVRDFSHVDDVVRAYRILMIRGVAGETYNIGSGTGRTIRSLVDELRALAGVSLSPTVNPELFRPAEIPSLIGDAAKLKALGWEAHQSVTQALRDVLAETI